MKKLRLVFFILPLFLLGAFLYASVQKSNPTFESNKVVRSSSLVHAASKTINPFVAQTIALDDEEEQDQQWPALKVHAILPTIKFSFFPKQLKKGEASKPFLDLPSIYIFIQALRL